MIGVFCWVVAMAAVVYLAHEKKEGWGWILFVIVLVGVPSSSNDTGDLDARDLDARIKNLETHMEQKSDQVEARVKSLDKSLNEIIKSKESVDEPVKVKDDSRW